MHFESFRTKDGTVLAAHHAGKGDLPIVLANGLGGTFTAWHPLVDAFQDRVRFYSWDYRGLYRSEPPADRETLEVPAQADDLFDLMDHFGVEKAIVAGWSMGVQVALEAVRKHPERIIGLILMNGTYGAPFDTAFGSLPTRRLLPAVLQFGRAAGPLTQMVVHAVARSRYTVPVATKLHLVDGHMEDGLFYGIAREFSHLDMDLYIETLIRLAHHDAGDVLADVEVPVLLISGDRDIMTPTAVTDRMVREMPQAELFVVPRGTHYCLIEYPEIVALRVEKFLAEHYGLRPHGPAAGPAKKKTVARKRAPAKKQAKR